VKEATYTQTEIRTQQRKQQNKLKQQSTFKRKHKPDLTKSPSSKLPTVAKQSTSKQITTKYHDHWQTDNQPYTDVPTQHTNQHGPSPTQQIA
jgi:hypothetical protein